MEAFYVVLLAAALFGVAGLALWGSRRVTSILAVADEERRD